MIVERDQGGRNSNLNKEVFEQVLEHDLVGG
jgi:hypothetical protein